MSARQGRPPTFELLLRGCAFCVALSAGALLWSGHSLAAPPVTPAAPGTLVPSAENPNVAPVELPNLRVRMEWGGGTAKLWRGLISVRGGTLEELIPLGVQPDEAATLWLENGQIHVTPLGPRNYHGLECTVRAPLNAEVILELTDSSSPPVTTKVAVPLQKLLTEVHEENVDADRNWVQLRRVSSDQLRFLSSRNSLVFAPGEKLDFELQPNGLGVKPGQKIDLEVSWQKARAAGEVRKLDPQSLTSPADDLAWPVASYRTTVPDEEGVYDLQMLALAPKRTIPTFGRGWLRDTIAKRTVQVIVLAAAPRETTGTNTPELVDELDPAHPSWWQRFGNLNLMPGSRKGPISAGEMQLRSYVENPFSKTAVIEPRQLVQLGRGDPPTEPAWQAYPLRVKQPGLPHVLEVEFPADLPQNLGITLVEAQPGGEGVTTPIDSGVYQPDEAATGAPGIKTHRIVFWPQTRSPLALLMNLRPRGFAVYGKLRVYQYQRLPAEFTRPAQPEATAKPASEMPQRMAAAYWHKPLLAESFSASEVLHPQSRRPYKDWQTFYEGTQRTVDFLRYSGRNTLVICAQGEGSALYPSSLVQPTPRFDSGLLTGEGQDVVRKDVLELLCRVFDREQLRIVPLIRFSAPLPTLEALRRSDDEAAVGLDLIGANGELAAARPGREAGLAPYYNPLDSRVQLAMLEVFRELVARTAGHKSLGGVAIELSSEGFAQLPGLTWGLDDRTVAEFVRDTQVPPPPQGPHRFAQRAQWVSDEPIRSKWLQWRCQRLARLYHRMQQELAQVRPEALVYLCPVGSWTHVEAQRGLRQNLPSGMGLTESLLQVGIDTAFYQGKAQPQLWRPHQVAPLEALPSGMLDAELNETRDLDQECFASLQPGSIFFHPPQDRWLSSFDARSPFKPILTRLFTQSSPAGIWNRQRFAHSLAALDSQALVDGGWLVPQGQDAAMRDFWAVYRALPAQRFQTVGDNAQPVTIRQWSNEQETYTYLVNDSPWPAKLSARLLVQMPCAVTGLGGVAPPAVAPISGGMSWQVEIPPYGLVGAKLASGQVRFGDVQISLPPRVETQLLQQVNDLRTRLTTLVPLDPAQSHETPLIAWNLQEHIPNPGFEAPPASEQDLPGWLANVQPGVEVRIQERDPHEGRRACVLRSTGPVATLASPLFDPPKTGVLLMSVWLRVEKPDQQPNLRLALEATRQNKPYYRFAPLGAGAGNPRLGPQWRSYLFRIDDLPLAELRDARVRFDLMGAGEVWLDDVQLSGVLLMPPEMIQLRKTVATARFALDAHRVSDARRLLAGYWPRLLASDLALTQTALAPQEVLPEHIVPTELPGAVTPPPAAATWYDRLMPSWFR